MSVGSWRRRNRFVTSLAIAPGERHARRLRAPLNVDERSVARHAEVCGAGRLGHHPVNDRHWAARCGETFRIESDGEERARRAVHEMRAGDDLPAYPATGEHMLRAGSEIVCDDDGIVDSAAAEQNCIDDGFAPRNELREDDALLALRMVWPRHVRYRAAAGRHAP